MLVVQSCPTLCDPVGYNLPGFSVHGILQARILDWVAIPFSRGSSWSRDWTWVSCIAGRFFTTWATQGNHWSLFQFCKSWYKLLINFMDILTCVILLSMDVLTIKQSHLEMVQWIALLKVLYAVWVLFLILLNIRQIYVSPRMLMM